MIISQTPLRISFLGGGTDFEDFYKEHGGAVLTTAIDKSVFVIAKERFDNSIYLNYSKKEIISNIDDIQHELMKYAMTITGTRDSIEITTLSDIPSEGSGLGSSSSITIALLHALYAYQDVLLDAQRLADDACYIEIDLCKEPIGKQDQYIAALGGLQYITFSEKGVMSDRVSITEEATRELNKDLMLLYTSYTRRSSSILINLKKSITNKIPILKELTTLAQEGRTLLENNDFEEFGLLLHESWQLKKELASNTSNSELDSLYDIARKAGAIGGKICGAGGGGFLLLYCPRESQPQVREKLGLKEMPVTIGAPGSRIIFDHRR